MIAALRTATRAQWIRFFLIAGEVRGTTAIIEASPDLRASYAQGFVDVVFILQHWDVALKVIFGG